ncbi:matrilin-1-like [Tubulanus polymorphus]|uniref:matrilin-1-like n=1 Tax=Tubulanus polymorphus TaxID=672921 RepID=UPI003DA2A075
MTMMTMTMLKMNIILSALSLLLASSATANTIDLNVCARKMSIDVIFLIDICDKIDAAGYTSMKNLINSMGDVLLEKSSMGPFGVQLAVAQYYSTTKKAELAIKLNQFTDLASFKGKVNSLVKDSGTVLTKEETRLTDVEEDALRAVNGARAAVNKAIIIITDGYKDATDEAVPLRAAVLQDLGYYIYAVTVGTYPNTDLINKITNSKENILNVPSATDAEFNNIKNQLLLKTCSVAAAESTFSCKPVDVIFVLDQSISADNRVYARSFIIRVINDVITNVGPNGAQVGLVIYGNAIKTVFNLKNFTTKADLVNAVNGEWAAVGKFGSDIGGGLLRAVEIFKTPDLGGRTDAQKLVIMTFDGQAKNGNTLTDAANKLKELKAVRVVVDMNARPPVPFQDKQLAEAAGIATVTGGEGSDSATGNLAAYINPPSKIESVVSQIEGITTSKFCVASCKQPLDVVFVFDQSISASNKLQHTLNFVKSLINDVFTTIGPSGVQVGLILYGNQVAKQFDLNKYKTKAELITAITTPVTANTGQFGSAVGSGLEEAVTMFNGGRKDARKLVVLTFDGQAKDGH